MAKLVVRETADVEAILEQLPKELRVNAMAKAVRAATNVVRKEARRRAPRGNPAHNPDAKPLYKTIGTKVKAYQNDAVWVGIVGPEYPAGSHGHLVEEGHDIYRRGKAGKENSARGKKLPPLSGATRAEAKEFMAPAVDTTGPQQDKAVTDSLAKSMSEASK